MIFGPMFIHSFQAHCYNPDLYYKASLVLQCSAPTQEFKRCATQ